MIADALPKSARREVVAARTAASRTFVGSRGSLVKRIYQEPVNFRNSRGRLVAVDNRLVRAEGAEYALRNAANRYSVQLPARASGSPVRISMGSAWVSFALVGAGGGMAAVDGAEARYPSVLPGVDVVYERADRR